jgi:hypothetical protein
MGAPPAYDPIAETEYLVEGDLADAEYDGTLRHLVSTYDGAGDRFIPGMGHPGPRVLDFSPLLKLKLFPINQMVTEILEACEKTLEATVEVEMAMTLPEERDGRGKLGFLQVRPMMAPERTVDLKPEDLDSSRALVSSTRTMGNGVVEGLRDVVYLRPDAFQAKFTRQIAKELEEINRGLIREGRTFLLVGFGRWGSSDPWLGVPVTWGMVSGARAIVEATLPSMNIEPSQGSHFFHNLSSLEVSYFTVRHAREKDRIDWDWLNECEAVRETEFVRHIRLEDGLRVRVDGRAGRGVVERP